MIDLDAVGHGNGLIYVGIPRERLYLNQFVDNRDAILSHLAESQRSCGFFQSEGHRVDRNRDQIVDAFLHHDKKPEWLFMMDSDMEHPIAAPIQLAKWNKPIVGALYFHRGQSHDPFVFDFIGTRKDRYDRETFTWAPRRDLVYDFLEGQGVPMRDGGFIIEDPSTDPLSECDAIGTGCIVIHRSVFEEMPPPWFEYRVGGNSEDLMFCKEAKEIYQIPVYCDLSTVCGHFHWVPMGQAQFRMNYTNRGINLTAYTKGMAARWWSKTFGCTPEEAAELISAGTPSMGGDVWKERFGDRTPSAEEVDSFYRDPEVGKTYVMELLHWNFLMPFNTLRRTLTPIKDSNVLEIGAGIGTVALQLWIQGCNVLACEVNQTLRDFMDVRYQEMTEDVLGAVGQISIIDDTWTEKTPDEHLDYVISFETFEHMPWDILEKTINAAWAKLKPDGRLIYTANLKQQDIYPMHFDYTDKFEDLLILAGFERVNEMEMKKVTK